MIHEHIYLLKFQDFHVGVCGIVILFDLQSVFDFLRQHSISLSRGVDITDYDGLSLTDVKSLTGIDFIDSYILAECFPSRGDDNL